MRKWVLCLFTFATVSYALFAEASNIIFENVVIEVSAGYKLAANLYRPVGKGSYPVIVSMTPYGKDKVSSFGYDDGVIDASAYTAYEALDPEFWVPNGYVLLVVDSAGMKQSEGQFSLLGDQEAKDYYDVIEWAGTQAWSNGAVGTAGVSYLAMNQWKVAAMNPPHLKAIMPWHGMSNVYRDMMYAGGMRETRFFPYWYGIILDKSANAPIEDMVRYQKSHPLYNDRYASMAADLTKITVPAYIAAAWSDNGLHLSGTIKAFERIGSAAKWLEVTGRKKWEQYYTWGAQNRMLEFADYYLKGDDNGWEETPQVRYEVMDSYYLGEVKQAASFPLPNTHYKKLYLSAGKLQEGKVKLRRSNVIPLAAKKQLRFNYTFAADAEISGHVQAQLFVKTNRGNDLDIFVEVEN